MNRRTTRPTKRASGKEIEILVCAAVMGLLDCNMATELGLGSIVFAEADDDAAAQSGPWGYALQIRHKVGLLGARPHENKEEGGGKQVHPP